MKLFKKLKMIVSCMLVVVILLSDLSTTLVYAQSIPQEKSEDVPFATLRTDSKSAPLKYLNAGHDVKSLLPAMADMQTSNLSAAFDQPATVRKLAKENYRPNEDVEVIIENGVHKQYKTELIDSIGNKVAVETDEVENGAAKVIKLEQPSSFRPGKYTLRVSDNRGGVSEQDFSWGVLAVNTDKSVYTPNEVAKLHFGVLDEGGNMVCDAQVELVISNQKLGIKDSLSTDNGKIKVNPECVSHDFTLNPDYDAEYKVGAPGIYEMTLKSQTKNGSYTISDSFEVRAAVTFDVKRITATRIYPPHTYPVTMEITANQDFEGTITETVPSVFKIGRPGEVVKSEKDEVDEMVAKQVKDEQSSSSAVTQNSPETAPSLLAPDNIPQSLPLTSEAIMAYTTINDLQQNSGVRAVLGASVPGLGMPFAGAFPVSQEFGESLVNNVHDHDLYESFGMHGHDGIDFAMPEGTPLIAVDNAKVLLAGEGDYGTTIVLQHSWGRSYYGHLSGVDVKEGDDVTRGQLVGRSGNTGISTGPHLHFGIKPTINDSENGYYGKVDPAYYLGMKQAAGAVLGASTKIEPDAPVSTDVKVLTWKVTVKKGETIRIGYNYLAPRISPQFYTLGPATFTDTAGKEVFHEARKWQIASDALDLKFKRGSFTKSTSGSCPAPCSQSVTGVGFKPKAVIFEWTLQTAETTDANQFIGVGFATSSTEERSVSYWVEDNQNTSDTGKYRSDTKTILMQNTNGTVAAAADFMSFDNDGFTINWSTNDANAYIIHYTAIGGSDVSNVKAGSYSIATSGATQSFTDPGFQPDFLMTIGSFTQSVNTNSAHAKMNIGYASSPTKEGAITILSRDNLGTSDSYSQQRTNAFVLALTDAGAQDAIADVASFDSSGFTLNVTDLPAATLPQFYLAIKGGQYDVGSFDQPTSASQQDISTGFRPSGVSFASFDNGAGTGITASSPLLLGGASRRSGTTWCNDTTGVTCTTSWATRKKITINNSASSENLTNFPLLVKLNSTRIDYSKTQNSGQDIRFVDPNNPNVALDHEIERWNESGDSFVWVRVPQIDSGSTTDYIWMYYDNAGASDGQNATGVWDSSYVMIQHLNETSGTHFDSTSNDNDSVSIDVTAQGSATGKIDGADSFNGTTSDINMGSGSSLDNVRTLTYSAWVNATNYGEGSLGRVFDKGTSGSEGGPGFYVCNAGCTNSLRFYQQWSTSAGQWSAPNSVFSTGTLMHVAVTYNGNSTSNDPTFYVNGTAYSPAAEVNTPSGTITSDASFNMRIGNRVDEDRTFNGVIDEARISNTIRSTDWIEAEYLSGNDSMNSFGSEQAQSSDFPVESYTQGSIWSEDVDAQGFSDANMYTTTSLGLSFGGANAVANVQSFDPTGFTLNWTSADGVARQILYWSAGSVTATQEDYRWYKNTDAITPTTALEDENQTTILAKNKPYARLRSNIATGGNGLNASTQGYKLQYAANQAEAVVGGTSDWCNDTTGITCTAPISSGGEVPAATPSDWCNDTTGVTCTSEWSSRRKITFNNAASSTALTDFPVLIKLDSTRIDYSKTQNSGQDIRFVDPSDPTVVLNHEIESWNEAGTSYVWVKVPQIDAKSTTDAVWMYYGNNSISDGQSTTGVWDSNYMGVWHLKEDPAVAGSNGILDSTSNNNNGTDNGAMDAADQVTGKANGSIAFDGVNDYINVPHNTNLNFANRAPFTISFWINSNAFNGNYTDVMAKDASNRTGWEIYRDIATNTIWFERRATGGTFLSDCDLSFTPSMWTHMTFRYDGTDLTCYKDTEFTENGLDDTGNMGAPTDSFTMGTWNNTVFFDGILDEVRISNNSRSVDWIKAEYFTTNDQFNTYGSEFSLNEVKQQSSGWQYRKKITFNNSEASGALTDFPVLVKLDNSRIDYNKVQDDGDDLRFVDPADNTTVLSHEIESWNENGTSYVWVKVPSLAAGTTDSIWMYYGNPGASSGQNATGVWDTNFRMVQHLEENPGTTCSGANEACDSTSNANNGNANGSMNSADQVSGKVNGSFDFDGTNDYINGSLSGTPITTNFTLSGWVNPANSSSQYNFISLGVNAGNRAYIAYDTGGFFFCESLDGSPVFVDIPSAVPAGSWYHLTCTQDNGTLSLYVNGILVDSSSSSITIGTNNYTLASDINASLLLPGKLDEVRMSSTARSADWVRAEYLTSADQMNVFGQEQPYAISGANTAGWTDVADVWCNDNSGITCDTGWANRSKITFNNQASSSNLTNFPILVKLNSARIDYSKTQNSGQDIRFVDPADPTTVLDHEIETWNESGDSYVWVEVPQIDGGSASDSLWMYYGNPSAPDGQNASSTWNNNYVSVFHLRETGNGTANEFNDSTSTNNDGRGGNGTAGAVPSQTTGRVGFGQNFDGSNDYIQGAQTAVLSGTAAYTIEAWINPDTCGESIGTIFKQMGTNAIEFDLCFTGASNYDLGLWLASSNSAASITNAVIPGQSTWYHVAAVHNGSGTVQFFINGVPVAMTDSTVTPVTSAGANIIGQDNTSSSTANFDGIIDEVRLSTTNRSADWMQATYLTGADQMNTYGTEESQTSSIWKFKNNANVSDGAMITSSVLTTSSGGNQLTYQESNSGFLNPTAIAVGEKREFDFSLDATATSNRRTYYFRIVASDGTPLTSYVRYPSITVGVPNQKVMRSGKFFNYKRAQPFTF